MSGVLEAIFFDSIYGVGIVGGLLYLALKGLGKLFGRNFQAELWAVLAGLVALFTLPTVPRLLFEKRIYTELESAPWARVLEATEWGSLSEPITWFVSSVGHFTIVSPDPLDERTFLVMLLAYDEDPQTRLFDVDCDENHYQVSAPDQEGVFRQFPDSFDFEPGEELFFCAYDWKEERKSIREAVLKGEI